MLAEDMLAEYLSSPFVFRQNESEVYETLRGPRLYVPTTSFPVKHPACNVKNMTAMFFDLFARFFKGFGLAKRPDVKYVSDQESTLIGELASCCRICTSDNTATARTMFMTNQDYFKKSSLQFSIRENEYGYLLLNTMSEELFHPKEESENKDS